MPSKSFDPNDLSPRKVPPTIEVAIVLMSRPARVLLHDCDPAVRKSVLLLAAHTSGISQKKVKRVVEALSELSRKYGSNL